MQSANMCEHQVQFYDDEAFLIDQIWAHIGPGIRNGETSIVIATKSHLHTLDRKYAPAHIAELAPSSQPSAYLALDAEESLSYILVDGWPDESRFTTLIGDLMHQVTDGGKRHVRAYGEMVALLCADGRQQAAIRLEQLWNDLGRKYPFSLLCAYPMKAFSQEEHSSSFSDICKLHTHVHAAESYQISNDANETHRTIAMLQQKASALEAEVARRKEIERALHLREKELADNDRRKDEFLAMLGHELRNPLAPIMNALELMRINGGNVEQTARCRETIARQVKLMTRLVDDLLDVSRITRGKIELTMEKTTMDHIVERAIEIAWPLIDERRHQLMLNMPAVPIELWGDSARLAQALANLLHNAAKYTDAGGCITVTTREEDSKLIITVSDNGIGLRKDLQEKIFELFVQDANALTKSRGGLGIGLTLVRTLVQLHGGNIHARSDGYGKGSEFVVTLPLQRATANDVAARPPVKPASNQSRSRSILIVDDNIDAAESLSEFLKASGHRVQVAHDGATAISEAAKVRPEVIILDIGMPKMNGYQVAQCLRHEVGLTSSLLVALTGYAQEHDRLSAQKAGFDHHFAKPLDVIRLATVLSGTCRTGA